MDLPVELNQHILGYLRPCDIVRLRQVSKRFRYITLDAAFWRQLYTKARLLLPPGPFSWQSTQYLEHTLVRSERVSNNWTSQPLQVREHTIKKWKREKKSSSVIIFGRWHIFCEKKVIKSYDIETDASRCLYDGSTLPEFRFITGAVTDSNGNRLCLLLTSGRYQSEVIKMLEFRVDDGIFSEAEITDWAHIGPEEINVWQSPHDVRGSAPFVAIRDTYPCAVLSLRTRCLYKLPALKVIGGLSSVLQIHSTSPPAWNDPFAQFIVTKTHVITIRTHEVPSEAFLLVQAFATPDYGTLYDRMEVRELNVTHQAAIRAPLHSFRLLRDSIVDPITGSVNIRLLHITSNEPQSVISHMHISCLDLILPASASTPKDVLPISIRAQTLLESTWSSERYTISEDGHVRGLLLTWSDPPQYHVRKFSIDASGEECILECGDAHLVTWTFPTQQILFDGYRLHYTRRDDADDAYVQAISVDVA